MEITFGYGKCWRPLCAQNVKANGTITVYVGMVNTCCECNFWWFERVVCREMYGQEKYASLVGTVDLQTII